MIFSLNAKGQDEEESFSLYEPVKITNPANLYSTLEWKPEMKAELIALFGEELAQTIIASSSESAWPKGIASLDARTLNQSRILEYEAYYMTTLNKYLDVILISPSENQHMEEDLTPKDDIYFVIGINAIEAKNYDLIEDDIEQTFFYQMEVITSDFANNFYNLLDKVIQEPNENGEKIYSSKVNLKGAYNLNFYEDTLLEGIILKAEFPGDIDYELAFKKYQDLVYSVEYELMYLDCCVLGKNEETVRGKSRSQKFKVDGYLDPRFHDMVIEVTLKGREIFNTEGQLDTTWEPVLYIFEN